VQDEATMLDSRQQGGRQRQSPGCRGGQRGGGGRRGGGGAPEAGEVGAGRCKTPDFHGKSESLYHRDSPWISGYRVQNVSQIDTQSHTSHHIKLLVHKFITSPLWST
jgi:hypothetical protein